MKSQATSNSKSPQARLIQQACGAFTTKVSKMMTGTKKNNYTK
jgi:hypothetical protein